MLKTFCHSLCVIIGLLVSTAALCDDEAIIAALAKMSSVDQLTTLLESEALEPKKTFDEKSKFFQMIAEEIPRLLTPDLGHNMILALLPIVDKTSTNAPFKVRQFYLERTQDPSLFIKLLEYTPHLRTYHGSKMLDYAAKHNVPYFIKLAPTFEQISEFISTVNSNYAVEEVLKYFFEEFKPSKKHTLKMLNSLQAKHVQFVFEMFDDRLNLNFEQIPDLLMERVNKNSAAFNVLVDHFIHKSKTPEEFVNVLKLAKSSPLDSYIEYFISLHPTAEQTKELLNTIVKFSEYHYSIWKKITLMFLQSSSTAEDYIRMLSIFSDIINTRYLELEYEGICDISDQFIPSLQTFFDLKPSDEQIEMLLSKDYGFYKCGVIYSDQVHRYVREHYLEQTQDPSRMIELLTTPPHLKSERLVNTIRSLAQDYEGKFLRLTQDKNLIDKYDEILYLKYHSDTQTTSIFSQVTNLCSDLLLGKKG